MDTGLRRMSAATLPRQQWRIHLGWALTLALLPAATACGMNRLPSGGVGGRLAPGEHEIALRHDGRNRLAVVYVPPAAARGGPLPVILAFHGGGGEAAGFRAYAGLDEIADREGFVVVYPYGTGVLPRRLLTWNAGTGCCGYALDQDVDDVGFTTTLLDHLAMLLPLDPRRVYATGHSNGAMMAYRLAAERADRIAAIVPVAGAMDLDAFAPVQAVPVLHIHSVDDPRALYQGGLGPPFPLTDRQVRHRPVLDGLARWATRNGCSAELTALESRTGQPGSLNAGQTAARLAYGGCATGAPVEHWRLTGSGHGWPGRLDIGLSAELIGPPTTLVDAAAEAWNFFRRFSR
jgi:polyhydroxybutyrate depolymerase